MKLGEQIASLSRTLVRFQASTVPSCLNGKLDSLRTEQTALIAEYTMHQTNGEGGIPEDVREAIAGRASW